MAKYFFDYTLKTLEEICMLNAKPKFLAKQIYQWVYVKNVLDFHQMHNVSKENQRWLTEMFTFEKICLKAQKPKGDLIYLAIQVNQDTLYCTVNMQNNQPAWYVSLTKTCWTHCDFCQSSSHEWTNSQILQVLVVIQQTLKCKIQHIYLDTYFIDQLDLETFAVLIERFNDAHGFNIGKRKINWLTNGWNFDYHEWIQKSLIIDILFKVYTIDPIVIQQVFPGLILKNQKMLQNMQAFSIDSRNPINLYYYLIDSQNDSLEDLKQLKRFFENQKIYINLISTPKASTNKVMSKHLYNLVSIFANQIVIRQNNAFLDTLTCLQKENIFKK
ncbi:hypothetical protein [Ureaplasma zalophigenitalium]|uniref:Dual-specificity RNA methyltransferase RlmN N-terminal domain-containing protein n=1 Tax=Ureaplasma zalophigenitalium TaxID=907723 RepID=A0ABT3BP89_9BACT|nr:hypothetical protein [Ureaplasma zalophigenitalium]MCV3754003.1 hypothetical protein [Ureaplasma zalophigenitalium]